MVESGENFQELHEKIAALFENFKEELNTRDHDHMGYFLYNVNITSDVLMYKIKYEIDNFMRTHENVTETSESSAVNAKKSECLIKLQTLTSMLTCHIMDDYRKKMEGKK
ncbi:hypothetical protein TcasGA2_TC001188 [Tribolium castaneum]|uniref:Uncharacterized protein n=1 Tax=Tribolium castaneum TaxID=7070 RepID=D6WAN8_TRICA|nr:hypothetical protein TcasGA2_TC001188 [Tribolium castaneum]